MTCLLLHFLNAFRLYISISHLILSMTVGGVFALFPAASLDKCRMNTELTLLGVLFQIWGSIPGTVNVTEAPSPYDPLIFVISHR